MSDTQDLLISKIKNAILEANAEMETPPPDADPDVAADEAESRKYVQQQLARKLEQMSVFDLLIYLQEVLL